MHEKPVAIISNAKHYVGPELAVTMASAGYDLVLGEPSPETVEAVTTSVLRLGRGGERFTMEDILPVEDLGGDPVPHYQCYLILAWLRSIQLVERHGRLGYSVARKIDLTDAVEDCWNRLASRSTTRVGASDE